MGRPEKKGLNFFPLDVTIDDNFELIEAEHGIFGFGIVIKLWQKIYANGYFVNWEEDNELLFSRRVNAEQSKISEIVSSCFKREIFDETLYKKYKILTSKGIQKRYIKICSDAKRKNSHILKEHDLINLEISEENSDKTEIIPELIELIPELSTQRKEDKSKEEENKEDIVEKLDCAYSEIINYLNQKAFTKYRLTTKKTKDLIKARYNESFTKEDFIKVIDNKCSEWVNTDMQKFLRPETLFGNKFEGYLNQKGGTNGTNWKDNKRNDRSDAENEERAEMGRRADEQERQQRAMYEGKEIIDEYVPF